MITVKIIHLARRLIQARLGFLPKQKELNNTNIMYLLTEKGRENIWLEVRTSWPRSEYLPVRPDLTQSFSILSYDHLLLKILKFLFEAIKIGRPFIIWKNCTVMNLCSYSVLSLQTTLTQKL